MNWDKKQFSAGGGTFKLAMLVIAGAYMLYFSITHSRDCTIGFISGYTAAVGVVHGADVGSYYEDEVFAQRVKDICETTSDIYSPNPPTYALMMLPLTVFDFPVAKAIWTVLNLLMLALICVLINRHLDGIHWSVVLLFMLAFQPLYANMRMGQNYVFLLLMVTLIWSGWKSNRDWMMIAGLVLMTIFKLG